VFLDPAKLLVILIVALVVLGPDKLPTVARQMGAAWGELRRFRQRLETEVRGTFPDLPSSQQVVQAVRSPLSFLDQLADAHEREQRERNDAEEGANAGAQPDVAMQPSVPAVASEPGPEAAEQAVIGTSDGDVVSSGTQASTGAVGALPGRPSRPSSRPVGRTRPWPGSQSGEPGMIPDDPSMN
jgi:sec-independent protein translocase protein TatB